MSVSGYHGIDTNHVMNVDQYPATHTMQTTTNSRWFKAQVIFQIFIQAKPLFKQFKLYDKALRLSIYLGIGPKPLKIWAWVHFLFLFWRQKWKVLSLRCVFPCYLSYPRSGQTDVLHELLASWQAPSPPWCLLITDGDGPLLSLCHTYTLICNKIKVNFHWKFKIQTGFTMICSSEPWLYITT